MPTESELEKSLEALREQRESLRKRGKTAKGKKKGITLKKATAIRLKSPRKSGLGKPEAVPEGVVDEYPVGEKYARVRITHKAGEYLYEVLEPPKDEEKYNRIRARVVEVMDATLRSGRVEQHKFMRNAMDDAIKVYGMKVGEKERQVLDYYLERDFLGLNEIEPIMHDPNIEDISCDGIQVPLYVRHREHGSIVTNIMFETKAALESFTIKLSQKCRRFISYGNPLLDGTLPDGSRVNATFGAGVTLKGPTFTIRKFREVPFTPLDLVRLGTFSSQEMAYFWLTIEAGVNLILAGGTASGKTATMNALSLFIPQNLKVVSIEDTAELNLMRDNWIQSISRPALGTGGLTGEVTMFDLLKASFRQRPDYVIVGEVRGEEANVLFQGMASGHYSMGTIHAESVETIVDRLTSPPISLQKELISLVDIVIVMEQAPSIAPNARRVREVAEIYTATRGDYNIVFRWNPGDDTAEYTGSSIMLQKLSKAGTSQLVDIYRTREKKKKKKRNIAEELHKRKQYLELMMEKNVGFADFTHWINLFRKDRAAAVKLLKGRGKK
ncbi:MAG: type II/IV secretion system ATPase subunit [Candidatus Diapherotrites archaeon]|nr:type II/IV secretion system ATPase subunit [Candidatus Diapherotrites archaeon]